MSPFNKTTPSISKYANIQSVSNWTIVYFNQRVQNDVMAMPAGVLADYLRLCDAMTLFGADLRMPHSRALGDGLFELRPKGREGIGRVFYCAQQGKSIVVLHSFLKKTQDTPDNEMRKARQRLKDVQNG
jgi:phage-related protein